LDDKLKLIVVDDFGACCKTENSLRFLAAGLKIQKILRALALFIYLSMWLKPVYESVFYSTA